MARIALALILLTPAPALAHKLNLFAQVHGNSIVGRVYFPGDVPARQIDVIARDRSGHELARTKTDEQGNFNFTAKARTDYQITAETPDGHAASYTLSASELPNSLPNDMSETAKEPRAAEKQAASLGEQIEALNKQIQALRDQIDRSEQRFRFRDILGGIGYILGLTGIAFYVKSRRSKAV